MAQETGGKLHSSVSSKLLLLTICFVMVVEVFVYVPSVAQFRRSFLEQRMSAAEIAALSILEMPQKNISPELESLLLQRAGVRAIMMDINGRSQLLMTGESAVPDRVDASYDLAMRAPLALIGEVAATLMRGGEGVIRVAAPLNDDPLAQSMAIVLDERTLFTQMMIYSRNVLLLSIIISIFTAGLVFLAIHWLLVRPMRRITESMIAFSDKPDDSDYILRPSARRDEVGVAERELAHMQEQLRQALNQRRRLADLGSAVSKVNHDLRNILATAQLSSDRLLTVEDPKVRALSERLISAIDRAINLCERTLKYGRADEPPPDRQDFNLHDLVDSLRTTLGADTPDSGIDFRNDVPPDFTLYADPDQMFRVLMNLGRNALNAMEGQAGGSMTLTAERNGNVATLRLRDTGPGVPETAQESLFIPFKGSTGPRGTGLGLAIVAELVTANHGHIALESTGPEGTVFRIDITETRQTQG